MITIKWSINDRDFERRFVIPTNKFERRATHNELHRVYSMLKRSRTLQSYSITHV